MIAGRIERPALQNFTLGVCSKSVARVGAINGYHLRDLRRKGSADLFRPVAQLAEQRSPKPQVGGSIPSWPAMNRSDGK